MLIKGYHKLKQLLTQHECDVAANVVIDYHNAGRLGNENDGGKTYKDSYGLADIPELNGIYDKVTDIAGMVSGLKLKKVNSYSRIYFSNSMLPPHVDRESLDLTMSITLLNRTGQDCPLSCETYDGVTISHSLNVGDGMLVKGRDLKHWRGELNNTDGPLICLFLHWSIDEAESEEFYDFLDKTTCDSVIEAAKAQGFKKAEVLHGDGIEHIYDPSSRSCDVANIIDNFGIRNKLKKTLGFPELAIEAFQFLKYEVGGEFKPHFDALKKDDGNDRLFTSILYLNDDFKGGETTLHHNSKVFKPKTGKLIIWKNLLSGKSNPFSLHSGAPVIEGTKYILVMWLLQSFKER